MTIGTELWAHTSTDMISYLSMGKKVVILIVFILIGVTAYFYFTSNQQLPINKNGISKQIFNDRIDHSPKEWGLTVTGVKTRLNTNKRVIALTFDACGGKHGSGYDHQLINFLIQNKIPVTLFISGQWIDKNRKTFTSLASNPLFEIENHGLNHLPCSVNGNSAYGIKGTNNAKEVIDEIRLNGQKIKDLTGRQPLFFRSGTAHYDEIAVKLANKLGYQVVNFNINGDLGATASKSQIVNALLKAAPGSIVIMHMNQPEGQTAAGLKAIVPLLRKKGFTFVKLFQHLN